MLETQMGKTCQFIGDPHSLYIMVPLPDHSPLQRAPGNAISAILTLSVRLLFLPNLDFQFTEILALHFLFRVPTRCRLLHFKHKIN